MNQARVSDVIIIGGSYAGLSAAMALGRSMRSVLIFDSDNPCNKPTPAAHNLLGHDGCSPAELNKISREQVLKYPTVSLRRDLVTDVIQSDGIFEVETSPGLKYRARKILFATGISDEMPDIAGFSDCWGISVLHCPYCHGYEIKGEKTAIIASGNTAFEFAEMISHWTSNLTVLTNGPANFSEEQSLALEQNDINVIETTIDRLEHEKGHLKCVVFTDGAQLEVNAAYARPFMKQQCDLPERMGCEFHSIHIKVDHNQTTSIAGVSAAGDNCSALRSLSNAIAAGGTAGAFINKELIHETFCKDANRMLSHT